MKKIILCLMFVIPLSIFSLDLSVRVGVSNFTYSEVSYNKDNIYEINCLIAGPAVNFDLGKFKIYNFLGYQLPHKVTFKDALGEDPTNYIMGKFFYGFNNSLGVLYPFEVYRFTISPGTYINFDYIYLKDQQSDDEFIYSVLGNGISLDLDFSLTETFKIGGVGAIAYNYLPLYDTGNEFKYSYNYYFTFVVKLSL